MPEVDEFYDQDAHVYDAKRFKGYSGRYEAKLHQEYLNEFLKCLSDGDKLLEIGPGTGRFSKHILDKEYDLTAFDLSNNMLKTVDQKLNKDSVESDINLIQGDATNLPFKQRSFDGCLMINVTSHLPDPNSAIREISSILDSNSYLFINFPNLSGVYYPIGKYVNHTETSVQEDVYSRWYSYNEMVELLQSNGFTIQEEFGNMITPRREIPILNRAIVAADKSIPYSHMRGKSGYIFFIAKKE